MKNPAFGKWPADDEALEYGARREPADPAAEEAFAEVFERLSRRSAKAEGAAGEAADREAVGPRLALALPRDPVPDPRGGDLPWEKLHERPFTREEAAELLASGGVDYEQILACYLAGWQDLCDPETGRGPIKGQVVVALVKTEDGSQTRPVHLAFAWDEGARGWRLAKAMVEAPI